MVRLGAVPTFPRSSGMCATPLLMATIGGRLATSTPLTVILPVHGRNPVMTSASSLCPLPATPAIPKISPLRTCSETPRRAGTPLSLMALTFCTSSTTSPGSRSDFFTVKTTSRPTINCASFSAVSPAASMPSAVTFPLRSTVTRSAIWVTSCNLWLMKIMDLPCAAILRRVLINSSISCGASTAVGSSKIRMSAPR